jgi:STIP1 family protein 1
MLIVRPYANSVKTKTGQSYERASITEHLRRSQTDPLTREPLRATDLRPNIGLRTACEEYINENGWVVEY